MKKLFLVFTLIVLTANASEPISSTSINPLYALQIVVNTNTPVEKMNEEVVNTKIKLQESVLFNDLRASKESKSKNKTKIHFSLKKISKAMTIILKPNRRKIEKNYGIKKSLLKKLQIMYPELTKEELKNKIIEDLSYLE